jgi:translation initiation factor 4G
MTSNLQFGTVDDNTAVLSTSPAAPSTIADVKPVKNFGSIAATGSESGSSSPAVAKVTAPARTDSPAPASEKPKRKVNVASLFQNPQQPQAAAPVPTQVPQQSGPSQATTTPIPSQDGPPRPPPKHQGSYESPAMRNTPLPILSHQPNQTPSPMQPGAGPQHHFTPHQSHLRQGGNGNMGFNPPRSPNLSRAMTNGNMRGPPGGPVPVSIGSPRMGPPPATPTPSTPVPTQTPMQGVPPGMMNMPPGQVSHPPHMPSPVTPLPGGQMPHQMGIPPPMWGYYVSLFLSEYSLTDKIPSTLLTMTPICLLKHITGQATPATSPLIWQDSLILLRRNSKRPFLCLSLIWLRPLKFQ